MILLKSIYFEMAYLHQEQFKLESLVAQSLWPLAPPPYIEKKTLFSLVAHPFSPPPLSGHWPGH